MASGAVLTLQEGYTRLTPMVKGGSIPNRNNGTRTSDHLKCPLRFGAVSSRPKESDGGQTSSLMTLRAAAS
eukprot:3697634-Lingulodinium_polyedra.AAC.1